MKNANQSWRTRIRRTLVALASVAVGLIGAAHAAPPTGHFVVNAEGTLVADSHSGLVWQRTAGSYMSCANAATYCASLSIGDESGFRLPTVTELATIVDESRESPAMDPVAFPGASSSGYWSSTANAGDPTENWVVYFSDGSVFASTTTNLNLVRCVR